MNKSEIEELIREMMDLDESGEDPERAIDLNAQLSEEGVCLITTTGVYKMLDGYEGNYKGEE